MKVSLLFVSDDQKYFSVAGWVAVTQFWIPADSVAPCEGSSGFSVGFMVLHSSAGTTLCDCLCFEILSVLYHRVWHQVWLRARLISKIQIHH